MSHKIISLFAILLFCMGLPAYAQEESKQEAKVREAVEKTLKTKVASVKKAGYLGLYEVYIDGQVIYVDEKVSAILTGSLIDTKGMRNITAERLTKLSAIKFSDLPLAQAIKQVRGDGKRVLVTVEDPHCGYCKRLTQSLLQLDNITHYVFLIPMLSEESNLKTRQIWCASDRAKAWNDWMVNNKAPTGKGDCDTSAIDRNMEFGRRYNITGAPTIFFANGERVSGAIPVAQIEKKMDESAK